MALCFIKEAKADIVPTINPIATYTNDDGNEESGTSYSGSAPLAVAFTPNAQNTDGWATTDEWKFFLNNQTEPYLIRYEENTSYTFTTAGSHKIELYAIFVQGTDTIAYTQEYWSEATPITIEISESSLNMPNAFSPNGDNINDIYKAKDGYKSIVEFHAYIFNRSGQKIYEWTNPSEGWNGTHHGIAAKDGVYFCLVKAKGADGRIFNIKTDVNLLRGYKESNSNSSE